MIKELFILLESTIKCNPLYSFALKHFNRLNISSQNTDPSFETKIVFDFGVQVNLSKYSLLQILRDMNKK